MNNKPLITIRNLSKEFDGDFVLKGLDLTIHQNEFVTLLGPSGCGKTTLLRILGGFELPTAGSVTFENEDLVKVPVHKREINTVFQKYALFPHLNVFENIAFGLRLKKVPERDIQTRVAQMLSMVKLEGFQKRTVDSLSGGQQQRVAIARALINQPKVLLLDEPLGALDLKLRQEMQYELKAMQRELGITFIFVTHDQEEALTMSDTIVVLSEGEIQQVGSPVDIYNEPKNRFVANFIGESNILEGTMIKDGVVNFEGHTFECVDKGFAPNSPVDVVIRPEDLEMVSASEGAIKGIVDSVIFKGVHYETIVLIGEREYVIQSTKSVPVGTIVGLTVSPENIHIMGVAYEQAP